MQETQHLLPPVKDKVLPHPAQLVGGWDTQFGKKRAFKETVSEIHHKARGGNGHGGHGDGGVHYLLDLPHLLVTLRYRQLILCCVMIQQGAHFV